MNKLTLAKRRASHRRREAGAAMFIVAMTMAVLASVGMYALAAAANEVRTSGNERQNTQTHYMSEYGVIGVTHEMVATTADFIKNAMQSAPALAQMDTGCTSLPGVPVGADPITKACVRREPGDFSKTWATGATVPYAGTTPYTQNTDPGSFGPTPMNGAWSVEITEATKASAAHGYSASSGTNAAAYCFIMFTETAIGFTQPLAPVTQNVAYANQGVELQRARIVAGPTSGGGCQ